MHYRSVVVRAGHRANAAIRISARPRTQPVGNLNVAVSILALVLVAQTRGVADFMDGSGYATAFGTP